MIRRLPILFVFGLLTGCSQQPARVSSMAEPIYSQQYRHGSATVIVSLSETNITSSGKIQLMIDVHAPEHAEVSVPDLGTSIAPFRIADGYAEPLQTLPNGKQLHRRAWMLTPGLPGETIFQPLEISAGGDQIKTAPISIAVLSLLPSGIDTFEIKDIAAPIALLPEEQLRIKRGQIIGGASGAFLLIVLMIILSCRPPKPAIPPDPHEAVLLALKQLPEDELERIEALNQILLQFISDFLGVPTVGKTLNEVTEKLPKKVLLAQRHILEKHLTTCEQIRFSHKMSAEFPLEFEAYILQFTQRVKERPCA